MPNNTSMNPSRTATDDAAHHGPLIHPLELAPLAITSTAAALLLIPGLDHAHWVGMIASVVAFAMFIPQAARVWRSRNDPHALLGVSVASNVFIINNALIWGLYALLVGEFWVGAAGIVNLPLAVLIVAVLVRSRHRQRRA